MKTKNIFLENGRAIITDFGLVNVARRLCSRYKRPGDIVQVNIEEGGDYLGDDLGDGLGDDLGDDLGGDLDGDLDGAPCGAVEACVPFAKHINVARAVFRAQNRWKRCLIRSKLYHCIYH